MLLHFSTIWQSFAPRGGLMSFMNLIWIPFQSLEHVHRRNYCVPIQCVVGAGTLRTSNLLLSYIYKIPSWTTTDPYIISCCRSCCDNCVILIRRNILSLTGAWLNGLEGIQVEDFYPGGDDSGTNFPAWNCQIYAWWLVKVCGFISFLIGHVWMIFPREIIEQWCT